VVSWLVFDEFSRQHHGWLVTMEAVGTDIGYGEETTLLPLVGISADQKDGGNCIAMMVGGSPDSDIQRMINEPKNVWFRHSAMEGYDAIEVESESETKTLFRFVPAEAADQHLPQNVQSG
jgi:Family of unknown function (DUF5335)